MLVHLDRIAFEVFPAADTQVQHFREIGDHLDIRFVDKRPDGDHQLELVEGNVREFIEYTDMIRTGVFEVFRTLLAYI